ncbi:MAG: efflux RND transporter periplasmic adaptor subunit [Sedimentisphaerales bacterium]|jgi:multidrug efflux system membrane fusion protein
MNKNNCRIKIWSASALVVAALLTGCSRKTPQASSVVPVSVAQVTQQTLPLELSSFGIVEANMSVTIKSQVAGILTAVHFKEGQEVNKGDLLVSIDSRSFEAELKAAQGNLEKDEAQLKNAEKEASRQTELLKKGYASQNDYDNSVTAVDALKATVDSDKAAVEDAAVQVDYCSIRSPINGVIGAISIDQGNLIKEKDIPIASINQISPIRISFTLPQQYLPLIRKYMAGNTLEIIAKIPGAEGQEPVKGALLFIDNSVDTGTGTIRLWGISQNEKRVLWPGLFVNVVLNLAQEPNVIVVPSQAIQNGQQGQFVYVVKADNTAEIRPITVQRTANNSSVVEGVEPGETVVTDGQLRLVAGTKVQIKETTGNKN